MPAQHDLARLVAAAAAARPEAPALVAGRTWLTWAEPEDEVARLATGLGEAGIVAGQRVLIALGREVPTPTVGGRRATSGSSTRAATCSWSTGSRSW